MEHQAVLGRTHEGELAQLAECGADIVTTGDGSESGFIELAHRRACLEELAKMWVSDLEEQPLNERPDD
jgi:hypothetical protein